MSKLSDLYQNQNNLPSLGGNLPNFNVNGNSNFLQSLNVGPGNGNTATQTNGGLGVLQNQPYTPYNPLGGVPQNNPISNFNVNGSGSQVLLNSLPQTNPGTVTPSNPKGLGFNLQSIENTAAGISGQVPGQNSQTQGQNYVPFNNYGGAFNGTNTGNFLNGPGGTYQPVLQNIPTPQNIQNGPAYTAANPPSASALAHSVSSLNQGYQNYNPNLQNNTVSQTSPSSSYAGSMSPYGQQQMLTQDQWGASNGLSPYLASLSGNAFTPDEWSQIGNTQAAGYSNEITNTNRALAWNMLGVSGSGTSATGTSGTGSDPFPQTLSLLQNAGVSGVTGQTPLSQVMQSNPNELVSAINGQEGGSPQGVNNNPGNIKWGTFASQVGGTDSGVQAQDGGTFASFPTQQDGTNAELANLQGYLKQNPNMTLEDAVDMWKGYSPQAAQQQQTQNFQTYGLLATVPSFDPNTWQGKAEANYISTYLNTQKVPTASSIGLSGPQKYQFTNIENSAQQIYSQATGNPLPSVKDLQSYQDTYTKNVGILNNLQTASSAVQANGALMINNLQQGDFNGSNQLVNAVTDAYKNFLGDGSMATYLAQNQTVTKELGNLFAVKNASGTTVADKMSSEGIFNSKQTLAQQQGILNILSKEASNVQNTFVAQNANIFKVTDPLLQDPQNPLRQLYQNAIGSGPSANPQTLTNSAGQTYVLGQDGTYYPQ